MGSSSCRRAPQERVSEYRLIASRKGTSLETPPPRSSGLSFIIISRYQTFLFFLNIFSSQTPSLNHFLLLQVISDATNSRQTSSPLTTRRFLLSVLLSRTLHTRSGRPSPPPTQFIVIQPKPPGQIRCPPVVNSQRRPAAIVQFRARNQVTVAENSVLFTNPIQRHHLIYFRLMLCFAPGCRLIV